MNTRLRSRKTKSSDETKDEPKSKNQKVESTSEIKREASPEIQRVDSPEILGESKTSTSTEDIITITRKCAFSSKFGSVHHRYCVKFTDSDIAKITDTFLNMARDRQIAYFSSLVDLDFVSNTSEADYYVKTDRKILKIEYHLFKDNITYPVCKKLFLEVLSIEEEELDHWLGPLIKTKLKFYVTKKSKHSKKLGKKQPTKRKYTKKQKGPQEPLIAYLESDSDSNDSTSKSKADNNCEDPPILSTVLKQTESTSAADEMPSTSYGTPNYVCRACGTPTDPQHLEYLYSETQFEGPEFSYLLDKLLDLQVHYDDGRSQFICYFCAVKLQEWYMYKEKCHEAQRKLLDTAAEHELIVEFEGDNKDQLKSFEKFENEENKDDNNSSNNPPVEENGEEYFDDEINPQELCDTSFSELCVASLEDSKRDVAINEITSKKLPPNVLMTVTPKETTSFNEQFLSFICKDERF